MARAAWRGPSLIRALAADLGDCTVSSTMGPVENHHCQYMAACGRILSFRCYSHSDRYHRDRHPRAMQRHRTRHQHLHLRVHRRHRVLSHVRILLPTDHATPSTCMCRYREHRADRCIVRLASEPHCSSNIATAQPLSSCHINNLSRRPLCSCIFADSHGPRTTACCRPLQWPVCLAAQTRPR